MSELTVADLVPFLDPLGSYAVEVAAQKRLVAILQQQLVERDTRIAELEAEE